MGVLVVIGIIAVLILIGRSGFLGKILSGIASLGVGCITVAVIIIIIMIIGGLSKC
jgi:hypothetical protein